MRLAPPLLLLVLLASAGCVERKFLIRTDPPGATVRLNQAEEPAGVTPLEIPFDYYGTFDVRVEMEGYESRHVLAPLTAPWYAYPVFDFVTELLLPITVRDHRELTLTLAPEPPAPRVVDRRQAEEEAERARLRNEELIKRAEEMRRRVNEGDPAEVR